MKKSIYSTILRFAIGLVLILFLLYKLGIPNILAAVKTFNYLYFIPIVFIQIFFFAITGFNLKYIISPLKNISYPKCFSIGLYMWAARNILPANFGDLTLLYFLKKENVDIGPSTAVFLIDKTTALILGFIICTGTALIYFDIPTAMRILTFAFLAFLILGILLFTPAIRRIVKTLLGPIGQRFTGFFAAYKNYFITHTGIVLINLGINLLRWIISSLPIYFALRGIGIELSFITTFLVNSGVAVIALIPLSISGLGIREVSASILFSKIGFDAGKIASGYLVLLVFNYLLTAVIFAFMSKEVLTFSAKGDLENNPVTKP
ncbi:MAG: lysylphosphatidylglycerol synthase transmembrane domain-containing protein [Elusimicrobiota bacterium]